MSHSISKLWMPSLGHSWNQCTQPQAPPWETQGYVESHRIVSNHRVVQSTMCHFQHLENAMLAFSFKNNPMPRRADHVHSVHGAAPPRSGARPSPVARTAPPTDGGSMSNRRRKRYIYICIYIHIQGLYISLLHLRIYVSVYI